MKRNIMKTLLVALLIMALLAPVAVMEETPAGEPIAAEAVETNETPTEPDESDDSAEAEAEPDDTAGNVEELIIAEAFEAARIEAADVELEQSEEDIDGPREADGMDLTGDEDQLGINFAANGDGSVTINSTNFPDAYFRAYIAGLCNKNDGDTLTYAEIQGITTITVPNNTVSDLTGIKLLTNLQEIGFEPVNSSLETLDVAGMTTLQSVDASDCRCISTVNIAGCTNLKYLNLGGDNMGANITTIDASGLSNLEYLHCSFAPTLASVIVSGCTNMKTLNFRSCGLSALDVSDCKNLESLVCWSNNLSALDVSKNTALIELDCDSNNLGALDVSKNTALKYLNCTYNKIPTLDVSNLTLIAPYVSDDYKRTYTETDEKGNTYKTVLYCADVNHYNENGYDWDEPVGAYLWCDDSTEIIKKAASSTSPAPAPAPVASAPAPATPIITATAKNTKTSITAAPGTTAQLNLGGAAGKSFKSSNRKVATVDKNGNITFKKAGKVKITFKVGKKKRTVTIKVTDPTVPTNVAFQLVNTAVKKGDSVTLTPVVNEGANPSGFKWKSSNKKVATVKNGVVKFKKPGKVTITCTAKRGKKKAKIRFTVGK